MRALPDRLDRGAERLAALRHRLLRCAAPGGERLLALSQRLHLAHPQRRLDQASGRLDLLRQRLLHACARLAEPSRAFEARRRMGPALDALLGGRAHRLELLGARLGATDPRGPLERGFALVRDLEGRAVTRAAQAPAQVELQWLDGSRRAALE
jgi:exodeoxyribonuclease VII large subunit